MNRPTLTVEPNAGHNPQTGTVGVRPMTPLDTSEVNGVVGGSIDSVRAEIDDAFADIVVMYQREPDEVMRMCSGHSARLSALRVLVMRIEDYRREWKTVRTRELEPTLDELRNQYEIASRLHTVREFDWRVEMGER